MHIKIERRVVPSKLMGWLSPLLAIAGTLIFGVILFSLLGKPPISALNALLILPISNFYGLTELIAKTAPLILCGVGLALCFRGKVWNVGTEGQLTIGAILGGGLALAFQDVESYWILVPIILAGGLGGVLWASIPALLRSRFNANELLTSLMLNYVAISLLNYLVHGPWRNPQGYNFPETVQFSRFATLPLLVSGSRIHWGIIFAIFAVGLIWLLLNKSFFGFQVKVVGSSKAAAEYAGFSFNRVIWMSFLISGALAGLAGVCEVTGTIGQLRPSISPGYGYTAIIAAFIGKLNPIGIIFSSLLLALLYMGGEMSQISLGLPSALSGIFQGTLFFLLLAADALTFYRLRWQSSNSLSSTTYEY